MMKTDEFQQLTCENVTRVLVARGGSCPEDDPSDRRKVPRWPFPGPVELWVPLSGRPSDETEHVLGTTLDLSTSGVGLHCDCELPVGLTLAIAIHEPEVTLHGDATVRYCAPCPDGFKVGLEFVR
ncbi:MAG: PilZ domain-containing protein [Planctomycetes bacterium]|nr:PilZ domain-containing protein [Planctomycetota bacterium]